MRKLFSLLVVFSLMTMPFTGCARGPEEAEEGEGEEGMDDMSGFDDAAKTGEDDDPTSSE